MLSIGGQRALILPVLLQLPLSTVWAVLQLIPALKGAAAPLVFWQEQTRFRGSWMLMLNGIKLVRQVCISVSVSDRRGGECHTKSVLIFLLLSNADPKVIWKGLWVEFGSFPESSTWAVLSKCPVFRNGVNRKQACSWVGNIINASGLDLAVFYRGCWHEAPHLTVRATCLCAPGLLWNTQKDPGWGQLEDRTCGCMGKVWDRTRIFWFLELYSLVWCCSSGRLWSRWTD